MRPHRVLINQPLSEMPGLAETLAEERRIAEAWAPHYDRAGLSNAYVYRIERARFAAWVSATLRSAGRDPGTLALLDAGCGTGDVVDRVSREGFGDLTGLDLSAGMLREARARKVPGARWVEGLIEEAPFDPGSFDVVLGCFTVHHLADPGAFFRLADHVLRPGGWFFVLEYDRGAAEWPESRGAGVRKAAGDLVRAAFARKNRRVLQAQPTVPRVFNPAHRLRGWKELRGAIPRPGDYELHRISRGLLLPALVPVLVEESALDRWLARWAEAVDNRLAPRTGGLFQWIAGRRRS
jgi:ubiquinone/menaquinone biosynthesis C-methylase UbiE